MWLVEMLVILLKILVGAFPRWVGCFPNEKQRIYFSNHTSHADTLAIWSSLPFRLRKKTHPVAALDYWNKGFLKRYIAKHLGVILIKRKDHGSKNPLDPLFEALSAGASLIVFPEGSRGNNVIPGEFKSGLYHLARSFPEVELVPVYLENLQKSLPKGTWFPLPIVCSVYFGPPIHLMPEENKAAFLARARESMMELI